MQGMARTMYPPGRYVLVGPARVHVAQLVADLLEENLIPRGGLQDALGASGAESASALYSRCQPARPVVLVGGATLRADGVQLAPQRVRHRTRDVPCHSVVDERPEVRVSLAHLSFLWTGRHLAWRANGSEGRRQA